MSLAKSFNIIPNMGTLLCGQKGQQQMPVVIACVSEAISQLCPDARPAGAKRAV